MKLDSEVIWYMLRTENESRPTINLKHLKLPPEHHYTSLSPFISPIFSLLPSLSLSLSLSAPFAFSVSLNISCVYSCLFYEDVPL